MQGSRGTSSWTSLLSIKRQATEKELHACQIHATLHDTICFVFADDDIEPERCPDERLADSETGIMFRIRT